MVPEGVGGGDFSGDFVYYVCVVFVVLLIVMLLVRMLEVGGACVGVGAFVVALMFIVRL